MKYCGKNSNTQGLEIDDKRMVKLKCACQALPGRHLFQFWDKDDMGADAAVRYLTCACKVVRKSW